MSESAKERIRRWWWLYVQKPTYTLFFKTVFAINRSLDKRKESAKKRNSDREGWDPKLSEEDIKYIEDLEERGGVW